MSGTDSERYQRAVEIFLRACELPEASREAFVRGECAGDAELEASARSLLRRDEAKADPLDRAASGVAQLLADIDALDL